MDVSKKEYITKLRKELDSVESRFTQQIELSLMEAEDNRTAAAMHMNNFQAEVIKLKRMTDEMKELKEKV